MSINIDLATTKSINIEQINNMSCYIFESQIDNIVLKKNMTILVKNQTSYYLNNIYIIKENCLDNSNCSYNNIKKPYFLCFLFNNTLNNIYKIKYGKFNKNKLFYKNNNSNLNIYLNYQKKNTITKIKTNSISNNQSLSKLYSLNFYLYYFKPIYYFNKNKDINIFSKLNNNQSITINNFIISNNKKYFLTINNNKFLILYNNNKNINWWYYCNTLHNIFLDNNNNLIFNHINNSKSFIINNNRFKYKGLLINQGPSFSLLKFENKSYTLPDKIILYENSTSDKLYINPINNTLIDIKFNDLDINRQLILIKTPDYKDILSNSFRNSLNNIINEINNKSINNNSDLKHFIYKFIKKKTYYFTTIN